MKKKQIKSIILGVAILLVVSVVYAYAQNKLIALPTKTINIPPRVIQEAAPVVPQEKPITITESTPAEKKEVVSVLESIDHAVPFTAQAPSANWDAFHEEACEEASAVMVAHYFQKTPILSAEETEKDLSAAAAWERANVGTDVSISAKDAVRMLREHFKLNARLETDVSASMLKKELSAGNLIIAPAQGQFLHNPNFKQPGPRYHMLVVRGYDGSGMFITNDPGTRKGEKYQYPPDVLVNAIHDWNNGDVENGARVAIVVSP